jgi:hypothetical protein
LAKFYTDLRILLIQRIADLSNILARIVDLACNLVMIRDCYFVVELLADSNLDNLDKGYFASNLGGSADLYTPIHPPPPLPTLRPTRALQNFESFIYKIFYGFSLLRV